MGFSVKVTSTQTINPSTPTPPHLKSYTLALLDHHFSVFEYRTPLVQFYAPSPTRTPAHTVDRLRLSLSKALSLFRPLAGRLSPDGASITCSDDGDGGVPFLVAHANAPLSHLLASPDRVDLVPLFLPHEDALRGWVPLAVQVTLFTCGGVAVGTHVLHKCLDGISRAYFFKAWAALAAGRDDQAADVAAPDLSTSSSLFPPCPGPAVTAPPEKQVILGPAKSGDDGGCVVKAFGFGSEAIAALQWKCRSEKVPHPTRVEAVSAFLWKHLMAAVATAASSKSNEASGNGRLEDQRRRTDASAIIHSVNMRPHLRPPLPPTIFGKFTTHAIARHDMINNNDRATPDLPHLVATLRGALVEAKDFKSVSEFLGERGKDAVLQRKEELRKLKKESTAYTFTSWSGLDVDFGLGMPVWVGLMGGKTSAWFRDFVVLIHTPSHGIDAWLVLGEEEMAALGSSSEFLAFASPLAAGLASLPTSSL